MQYLIFSFWLQFSSVTQSCPTICDPVNRSTPGLPVHHQLPEFTQTHVHRVSDAIQPFHPLSSPYPFWLTFFLTYFLTSPPFWLTSLYMAVSSPPTSINDPICSSLWLEFLLFLLYSIVCTTSSLSIHLLVNIQVASMSWLL